jgi:hypothetical protein
VGAWFGEKLAAVLFPTGDTQQQLRKLAERSPSPPELMLIVNPQWELQVGVKGKRGVKGAQASQHLPDIGGRLA